MNTERSVRTLSRTTIARWLLVILCMRLVMVSVSVRLRRNWSIGD